MDIREKKDFQINHLHTKSYMLFLHNPRHQQAADKKSASSSGSEKIHLKDLLYFASAVSGNFVLGASILGEITTMLTGSSPSATDTKCPFPADMMICVPG